MRYILGLDVIRTVGEYLGISYMYGILYDCVCTTASAVLRAVRPWYGTATSAEAEE